MQAAQRLSNVATHLARSVMTDSALSHGPKELQNKGLVLLLAQTPNGARQRQQRPHLARG
jgi:fructoselysine-6-P-deglycase FrlB-like protein